MSNVAINSVVAFNNFKSANKDISRQLLIYETINKIPNLTANEYSKLVLKSKDANFVRPRITELLKANLIKSIGKRRDSLTGQKASVWSVNK